MAAAPAADPSLSLQVGLVIVESVGMEACFWVAGWGGVGWGGVGWGGVAWLGLRGWWPTLER